MNNTFSENAVREVLSRRQSAAYLGLGLNTFDTLDIPKIVIRKKYLYRLETLRAWAAQHEGGTAQTGKGAAV
jgi:hypothetical protein